MKELNFFETSQLWHCEDCDAIDKTLNDLGVDEDISQRVIFLYRHMNIKQSFSCPGGPDGLTMEEEYAFAKHQLVWMNKNRMQEESEIELV